MAYCKVYISSFYLSLLSFIFFTFTANQSEFILNFPFHIAKRYLFSKKSRNAINVISAVSVAGVAIGTIALIVVLSVFNGFDNLVQSLLIPSILT